jgi:rRNA-processing protein FCF1
MKVVLDSNALLMPFECGIDVFRECERLVDGRAEFVAFAQSQNELSGKSLKQRMRAGAIMAALKKEGAEIIPGAGKVDGMILEYAKKHRGNVAVCTEDRGLMKRLRQVGLVQVIQSREKSHLVTSWRGGQ